MKTNIDISIKKDFHNTLKYGKSYTFIKKRIDILCEAVTSKLNGKYSVEYIAEHQFFKVSIYVPAWSNLPVRSASVKNVDHSLFIVAYRFAKPFLNSTTASLKKDGSYILWNTANCEMPGKAEYHISFWGLLQ